MNMTTAEYRSLAKPKRPKYGNRRTITPDGEVFDSAGEAARWEDLKLLQAAKQIWNLERQVEIRLCGVDRKMLQYASGRVAVYRADFAYWRVDENRCSVYEIEDFKGFITPEAKLKMAIVQAMYGRPVVVTRKGRAA